MENQLDTEDDSDTVASSMNPEQIEAPPLIPPFASRTDNAWNPSLSTTTMVYSVSQWASSLLQQPKRLMLGNEEGTIQPSNVVAILVAVLTAFYMMHRRKSSKSNHAMHIAATQPPMGHYPTTTNNTVYNTNTGRPRNVDTMNSPPAARNRSSTEEIPGILEEFDDTTAAALKDDHAPGTSASSSFLSNQLPLQGPSLQIITYNAWTPPLPWSEVASKSVLVLPSNSRNKKGEQTNKRKLERTLVFQLAESSLMVVESHNYNPHHHGHRDKKKHGLPVSSSPSSATLSIKKIDCHNDTYPVRWSLKDISLQVKEPVEGGVVQLYQKKKSSSPTGEGNGSSKGGGGDDHEGDDSIEFTFTSAQDAAQFQHDLVAYQILGEPIMNMYRALELIQRGSSTTTTQEYVLHHNYNSHNDTKEENEKPSSDIGAGDGDSKTTSTTDFTSNIGVSWDDAMRCFTSLQPLRSALERQLELTHSHDEHLALRRGNRSSKKASEKQEHLYCLDPMYIGKRRLLGYADFFRLFVPLLPPSSKLQNESNSDRMGQLLRWRKRVAKASVFVRSYVRARQIANQGWHLTPPINNNNGSPTTAAATTPFSPDGAVAATDTDAATTVLKKRIAFDVNHDNVIHDAKHKNEYYEASVSRDIGCNVHSLLHVTQRRGASTASPYQAYTLVGCHSFQIPDSSEGLKYNRDPVEYLPSLRHIIESHPDQHFLIIGFFAAGLKVGVIKLFVRSLPKGIDPAFDLLLDRFINGTKEVRDRKLEVFIQLGPGSGLSPLAWGALKAMSAILKWTRRGEADVPFESSAEARTPFPGMTINTYTEATHFGGSMNKHTSGTDGSSSSSLPTNYFGATANCDINNMGNMAARWVYQTLEDGALPSSIVDFSFVIEGQEEDELPERALATIRTVHMDVVKTAVPLPEQEKDDDDDDEVYVTTRTEMTPCSPYETALATSGSSRPPRPPAAPEFSPRQQPLSTSSWLSSFFTTKGSDMDNNSDANNFEQEVVEVSEFDRIDISEIEERHRSGVVALGEILEGVSVPCRKDGLSAREIGKHITTTATEGGGGGVTSRPLTTTAASLPPSLQEEDLVNCSVLEKLTKYDVRRFYVACKSDLKSAAVRIVESAAWEGATFPIDTRACRIELQSGQFFHQGHDIKGNPVFYFQTMLLGPWRKNEEGIVSAVLHRINTSFHKLSKSNPDFKCTVIILMGKPFHAVKTKKKMKTKKKKEAKGNSNTATNPDEGEEEVTQVEDDCEDNDQNSHTNINTSKSQPAPCKQPSLWNPFKLGINPRLDSGEEEYYMHSNMALANRMIELLSKHYPERLATALLVPGKGGSGYLLTSLGGTLGLRAYISDKRTRSKVHILSNPTELLGYVDASELASFVGGEAPITPQAFEYN